MKPSPEKQELLARLNDTREALSDHLGELGDRANLPRRFRHSFVAHPYTWLAGSLAAGVVVSSVFKVGDKRRTKGRKGRRRKSGEEEGIEPARPLMMGALAFAGNRLMAMSMPAIRQFVETELTRWLGDKVHSWRGARPNAAAPGASAPGASPQSAWREDADRTENPSEPLG